MDPDRTILLKGADDTLALLAPDLGGWLLRYARQFEGRGWEEALYWSREVVDRYPREMYAGNPILFPLVSWNRVGGNETFLRLGGPDLGNASARVRPAVALASDPPDSGVRDPGTEGQRGDPKKLSVFFPPPNYLSPAGWSPLLGSTIENRGTGPMPFSAGFHPYLYVPLTDQGRRRESFVRIPDCQKVSPVGAWSGFTREPFLRPGMERE